MECLYLILMIVVIQETSELNPDILKYDEWIKDAEIRVKKIKADEKRHVEYEKDMGSSIPNKRETDNVFVRAVTTVSNKSQQLPSKGDKFEDLRKNNKVFVDKSAYISKLLKHKYTFVRLCRPRNFGKSNFLQMLDAFFRGNESLFKDLNIHAQHDWRPEPVIYLDFNTMKVETVEDFKVSLSETLKTIGRSYGFELSNTKTAMTLLDELVYELSDRGRNPGSVVILVDEYDWPVRRNVEENVKVEIWEMTNFLLEFFREVQTISDKIRLLFMTCTTPLELRHFKGSLEKLKDLTYNPEFSEMVGLKEEELMKNFEPYIQEMVQDEANETFDSMVRKLRTRYDGYCFSQNTAPSCRLYSFHSVISALKSKNVTGNFWHASQNPKYNMIDVFQTEEDRRHLGTMKSFTDYKISKAALQSRVDFSNPPSMIVSMVMFGYLTFRGYDESTEEFTLDFPNDEVREKFIIEVLEPVLAGQLPTQEILAMCENLRATMNDKNFGNFIELLNRMAFTSADENQFSGVIDATKHELIDGVIRVFHICDIKNRYRYTFFQENYSIAGAIDLVTEVPDQNQYLFEFECNKTVDEAMKRLLDLTKTDAFRKTFDYWGEIYLTGVHASPERRVIDEWVKITYNDGVFSNIETSNPKYEKTYAHVTKIKKKKVAFS